MAIAMVGQKTPCDKIIVTRRNSRKGSLVVYSDRGNFNVVSEEVKIGENRKVTPEDMERGEKLEIDAEYAVPLPFSVQVGVPEEKVEL